MFPFRREAELGVEGGHAVNVAHRKFQVLRHFFQSLGRKIPEVALYPLEERDQRPRGLFSQKLSHLFPKVLFSLHNDLGTSAVAWLSNLCPG
jgi:hypothetical protein